jgi:hypothetical protein
VAAKVEMNGTNTAGYYQETIVIDGIERGLWQVNFGVIVARIGEEPLERVFQGTLEEVIREL